MRLNWYRFFIAVVFLIEMGNFFGWAQLPDRSADEVIAAGIGFLLFSIACERKGQVL